MENELKEAARYLPPYLLPKQREQLFEEIRSFPEKANYYLARNTYANEMLQGDGWGEFKYFDPLTGKEQQVKGLLLSNSCDISTNNQRTLPVKVLFSPLLKLDLYLRRVANSKGEQRAQSIAKAIKDQCITSIFYLPASEQLPFETIALLDNVVSIPLNHCIEQRPEKLFCLSQFGFYLFIMKLSIHLTRYQEEIARFDG
ncbi:MAG: hypothetical protein COB33_011150 [Thiotrichaceae bacterium]|nr:hypothetical protein [Thiotrichaceae bacterium]